VKTVIAAAIYDITKYKSIFFDKYRLNNGVSRQNKNQT
jgi:hypothetical protein